MEPRCPTWVPSKVLVLQATEAPQARVLSHALAASCFWSVIQALMARDIRLNGCKIPRGRRPAWVRR